MKHKTRVSLKFKTLASEIEDSRICKILKQKGITVHLVAGFASYTKGKREEYKGKSKPLMRLVQARKVGVMHPIAYGRNVKQLVTNLAKGNTECPSAYRYHPILGYTDWVKNPFAPIVAN